MDLQFTKGKFTEEELEKAIISLFSQQGYVTVNGENLHRKYGDILLLDDLKLFLKNQYKTENLTEIEIQKIINNIDFISGTPLYDGNKATFRLVTEGFDFNRDDTSKLAIHINYIDFETPGSNIFKVVNQYSVQGNHLRRPDVLLFVNGIPICICEFKTAIEETTTIYDAWKQIAIRYNRDIPNLMKYCFLSVISDGANTKMGSIFTPYEYFYAWNKVNPQDNDSKGIGSLLSMIQGAFTKERFLNILQDFIFYPDASTNESAIVTRYPQFFAGKAMLQSIKNHLKPKGDGKGGTYFGATGCGKTYTMLFLSRLLILRERDSFNNPTIIILVDREDLDSQTSELFVTAKQYLHESDVKSIEDRTDLKNTLANKPSGGVYITTIQKFCESIGELSDRTNIICISDEAHRTQTGIGSKLKITEQGVTTTFGFAKYLRDSLPNATYCGFTGTPIDETITVFGDIVDSYTMQEAVEDEITVRIAYEPRLARVVVSEEQAKEIEAYYKKCADEGTNEEQIEESKRAMSQLKKVLGNPERIKKLAKDMVEHYEKLCSEKPNIVQKAMVVCADRELAFAVYKEILSLRPEWGNKCKTEKQGLSKVELEKLKELAKINLVATRNKDDKKDLYDVCGTKDYRKMLDKQFKNNNSNFKIAVVVDMWITGFDIPSLAVMYIDKPLQKHTLIQTISRVNRVFEGKEKGLVVDYIGIKEELLQATKQYASGGGNPIEELTISLGIFKNHLKLVDALFHDFNANDFYKGEPLARLMCLNNAAEFIQVKKETQLRFMDLSKKLKGAYEICFPSGELTAKETTKAQFYLAIRSIVYKTTNPGTPDAEVMNNHVEVMVRKAINCTGVENIIDTEKSIDIFDDAFLKELDDIKLPMTKFNALLKMLKSAIKQYGKTNKVKSVEFTERLKLVVEKYNNRDNLLFTSEVVADFVNELSDELLEILKSLEEDKNSFEKLGISFEEKAFYDILVKVRDTHKFVFENEKCLVLASKIKELVDDKAQYADWSCRDDIKNQLNMDLVVLLCESGYPPEWDDEVFYQVMEQAENFKKYE